MVIRPEQPDQRILAAVAAESQRVERRVGVEQIPAQGAVLVGQPDDAQRGGHDVHQTGRMLDHARPVQHPRTVQNQRHMMLVEPQALAVAHMAGRLGAVVVIAVENVQGVVAVGFAGGQLIDEAAHIVVQQAHRVVLVVAQEAVLLHLSFRRLFGLEFRAVVGNGERPMVAGGLDKGDERLIRVQFAETPVGGVEQGAIGDAPDVHVGRVVVTGLVQLQVADIVGQQAADIRPAGVAADKVEPLVALEGVHQGVLIDDLRVARRGGAAPGHVGNAGDQAEHGARGAAGGHHEVREEIALVAERVQIGRRFHGVAVQAQPVGAHGFQMDQNHVGRTAGAGVAGDLASEIELAVLRMAGVLRHAQVIGHPLIVARQSVRVVLAGAGGQGVVEEHRRVQPQGGHLLIVGEIGVAPA